MKKYCTKIDFPRIETLLGGPGNNMSYLPIVIQSRPNTTNTGGRQQNNIKYPMNNIELNPW